MTLIQINLGNTVFISYIPATSGILLNTTRCRYLIDIFTPILCTKYLEIDHIYVRNTQNI